MSTTYNDGSQVTPFSCFTRLNSSQSLSRARTLKTLTPHCPHHDRHLNGCPHATFGAAPNRAPTSFRSANRWAPVPSLKISVMVQKPRYIRLCHVWLEVIITSCMINPPQRYRQHQLETSPVVHFLEPSRYQPYPLSRPSLHMLGYRSCVSACRDLEFTSLAANLDTPFETTTDTSQGPYVTLQ